MFKYEHRAKPVVKWAGGKGNSLSRLLERFPTKCERYIEPFLGGGAVFLALSPGIPALLNDANADLMELYRVIRDYPLALMEALDLMRTEYDSKFYYELRDRRLTHPVDRAARFLYLNKTCFNGLYRTNTKGEFNVPFGKRKRCPQLYERANLLEVAYRLRGVHLFSTDFEAILDSAEKGDLVYCDPPYLPVSATAHFQEYTADGFSWEQHVRLRDACLRAATRGAYVAISNAAVASAQVLYEGWNLLELPVFRKINAKGDRRGVVNDLLAMPPGTILPRDHFSIETKQIPENAPAQ